MTCVSLTTTSQGKPEENQSTISLTAPFGLGLLLWSKPQGPTSAWLRGKGVLDGELRARAVAMIHCGPRGPKGRALDLECLSSNVFLFEMGCFHNLLTLL